MVIDLTRGRIKFHKETFEMVGLTHRNPKHSVGPLRNPQQPETHPFFRVQISFSSSRFNRQSRSCEGCRGRKPIVYKCSACGGTGKTANMGVQFLLYQPNSHRGRVWAWRASGWYKAELESKAHQWLSDFCREYVGNILEPPRY